jgi:hypothetical protein
MNTLAFPSVFLMAIFVFGGCATSRALTIPAPAGATPYTAEQIRDANAPGTTLTFRIETTGADATFQTIRFLARGDGGARLETEQRSIDGASLGPADRSEATWDELRDHALFPPERTRRTDTTREGPTGRHAGWLYTVESEFAGAPAITRYWFAAARPGPPVHMEVEQDGEIVFMMELVEDSRP